MTHWPDIDRCRALKKAKYPQGKTIFNYVCVGESWIIDLTKKGDGLQRCAAPIVTELLAEILKIAPKHPRVKNMIDMIMCDDGTFMAGYFEKPMYSDKTLPNALADLWLWLRGREGQP